VNGKGSVEKYEDSYQARILMIFIMLKTEKVHVLEDNRQIRKIMD